MSVHQSFQQWQQSPAQGAIPTPQPALDWQKEFIFDALSIALPSLQAAADTAKHLAPTHSDLYTATCDALNACNEALERVTDAPDDNRGRYWDWDEPEYPHTPLACLIGHESLSEGIVGDPSPGYAYSGADSRGLPTHFQSASPNENWELECVTDAIDITNDPNFEF